MTVAATSRCLLAWCLVASASGCAVFHLPGTPRLEQLDRQKVFALAPPPSQAAPAADDPARASVDVYCGVGPLAASGFLYAAVSIRGRQTQGTVAPLNVSLVLDRSGSMRGKPFTNMLLAAEAFVTAFRDGDRVSIVAFSDEVFEALPPVVLDATTRPEVVARIRALKRGGSTWLSGGYFGGLAEVFAFFNEWNVNQVVLFSDGQPNRGVTDTNQLIAIAAEAADRGVGTTSIGFGTLHDELLMQGMADAGGGSYHYVGNPEDIPPIFQREAASLLRTAVRSTWASFDLPPGLALEDVMGWDYVREGNRIHLNVGAVPFGEERYAVLKLRPAGPLAPGALSIGVTYSDVTRGARFAIACQPAFQAGGGQDTWALEAAGRAEAAWGLGEAMGWADAGMDVFAISQLGHTRDLLNGLRQRLGPQALTSEDRMLADAQTRLEIGVADQATRSFFSGGLKGLTDFGLHTAERTAAAAAAGATFRPMVRQGLAITFRGTAAMRFSARGQRTFKLHKTDRSNKYKQTRFDLYLMMRTRPLAR